jgi:hypothetical protein
MATVQQCEISGQASTREDTLERNFAGDIEKGRETAKASLRRFQWKSAAGGNVTMQIWLGKQLLGQTDKVASQPPEEWKFGLGDGPRPRF